MPADSFEGYESVCSSWNAIQAMLLNNAKMAFNYCCMHQSTDAYDLARLIFLVGSEMREANLRKVLQVFYERETEVFAFSAALDKAYEVAVADGLRRREPSK